MTSLVPDGFDEKRVRLALGLELVDNCHRQRAAVSEVAFDRWQGPFVEFQRHLSGVYTLLERAAQRSPIGIRIFDSKRRYVPRRLEITLTLGTPVIVRPHLFPGSAYDASYRQTGLFGLVLRGADSQPVRWARVEARLAAATPGSGRLVGRTMADDRGEYLILLQADASTIGALVSPLSIEVTAFGPLPNPPVPATPDLPDTDPYWDVPLEVIPVGAGPTDPVVMGSTLPATFGATPTSTIVVSCPLGQLVRAPAIQFQ
jgi:hypothetical protein